jgi:hypothetical protein
MSALTKITTRAKHIRRIHGGTWKAAVKKASVEYRAGKLGSVKKKAARRKTVRRVKALHAAEGRAIRKLRGVKKRKVSGTLSDSPRPSGYSVMGVRSTANAAAIGRLTTAQHIGHAKEKIAQEIGRAEIAKFRAKTKTAKRKISKRLTALKSRFRKLC